MNWEEVIKQLASFNIRKNGDVWSKDLHRVILFYYAIKMKLQLLNGSDQLQPFVNETMSVIVAFVLRGFTVLKGLWKFIGRDPFKGERETVRVFAKKWSLDDEFVKAMG